MLPCTANGCTGTCNTATISVRELSKFGNLVIFHVYKTPQKKRHHWSALYLVQEGCSREDHRELTCVVGVVEPTLVPGVPCMEATRKANDTISGLPPHPAWQKKDTDMQCNLQMMDMLHALQRGYTYQGGGGGGGPWPRAQTHLKAN